MAEARQFKLGDIKGGAVPVLFDYGMTQVVASILDPNRPAKKKRTLTLTFDFVPNEQRDEFTVQIGMAVKGPGLNAVETRGFVSRRVGLAYLNDVTQEEFGLDPSLGPASPGDPPKE